jgi:DNA uptake protein ComE-like DNA-binding protein
VDSTELVKLPGIGPATALKIIRYRERLGGYSDITQLAEIEGMPDSLMKWFIITDTIPVNRIPVNKATLAELRRHPYIDFYQARAIVEFRKERGIIKGPEQLSFMEEFTAQDLIRLEPYLDFSQDQ